MNLSMKWLKEYVPVGDVAPREFAEAMTMSGSKVECWETEGEDIHNVVVGKVLSIERHPDADKLVICRIDAGQGSPLQIVTGAGNLNAGDIVPVALDGSTLPGGKKIKKGKLRGVESQGMLCSLSELGLTAHDFPYAIEDGIFVLQEDCRLGQDIQSAIGLNDVKVEFEITSNRPDCLSVIGLAREAAVTFQKPLNLPVPKVENTCGDRNTLSVRIDNPTLCSRYAARLVKNVKIEASPRWMRERLRACGVRPINNIVDITNYVMLEYGHPMHAFDLRYLDGGEIVVRNAREGEEITTLDGVERRLSEDMLVIADRSKPVAVAGVMGGEYSGIMDDTNTIVFESACFNGPSVRVTAKKLGLRTDASARFEKGLDPLNCGPALDRACELVQLLGAGEVVYEAVDCDCSDHRPKTLKLEPQWINRFLGVDIAQSRMEEILTDLGFTVQDGVVTVPSFRVDVEHKADLAEEIARIYGYNNIPSTIMGSSTRGCLTEEQKFENRIHSALQSQGVSEIMTYSFISPRYYDKICMPQDAPQRKSVTIQNPLGEDSSVMRTTAIPSMMEILSKNYNFRNMDVSLYEIATEYLPTGDDTLPVERSKVVVGMYGEGVDFFTLKGAVEELLQTAGISGYDVAADKEQYAFHPGRCARLTLDGRELGVLGEIHPAVQENYGIGTRCYVAYLDFNALFDCRRVDIQYAPLPRFPAATRDLAILCDESLPVLTLEKIIRRASGSLLESVSLFDVYQGKQIEPGKKSVAYSITLRDKEQTITDERADAVVKRILKALEEVNATLRV